jgi:hypothetical protein
MYITSCNKNNQSLTRDVESIGINVRSNSSSRPPAINRFNNKAVDGEETPASNRYSIPRQSNNRRSSYYVK